MSTVLSTAAPLIRASMRQTLRLSCCCGPQSLPYSQPTRSQLHLRLDFYSVSQGDTLITSALMRPGRNNATSRPSPTMSTSSDGRLQV